MGYWINSIPNQRWIMISSDQSLPWPGPWLSSLTNLWLIVNSTANSGCLPFLDKIFNLNPLSIFPLPFHAHSFPGASILLKSWLCTSTELQSHPFCNSDEMPRLIILNELLLICLEFTIAEIKRQKAGPFPCSAPQDSHMMQNCQEGFFLLISVYRADGFC